MVIQVGAGAFTVPVLSAEPDWESGIEWNQVGTKWKPLDYGDESQRWSSDVTIFGTSGIISQLREAIEYAKRVGWTITVTCASYEQIFGPEIDYTMAIECVVVSADEPYITGNLNESGGVQLTFSLIAKTDLSTRYLSATGAAPTGLRIISASRLDNGGSATIDCWESAAPIGFGFRAPAAEIVYEAKLLDAAKAIAYFQGARSGGRTGTVTFTSPLVWPFDYGTETATAYVLDVSYDGPIDKSGTMWRFTILFAKA